MARRKWAWTPFQNQRKDHVLKVVNALREYWPLTLRQIYYQLVAKRHIPNTRSQYTMLSTLVKWMRIDEMIPWDALEDRSRSVTDKRGYESLGEYLKEETSVLLNGYSRCLVQGQKRYVEVWTEKDALSRIFADAVWPYCVRAVVCRGYASVTFIADFYQRADRAIMKGQDPVVLYFGDLDPSGVQMLDATRETLEDELGLSGVCFKRIGLLPEHITEYGLPCDPTAAKVTDPRYKDYVRKYGTVAVELDALHPGALKHMIESALTSELDMADLLAQKEQERQDLEAVEELRYRVLDVIEEEIGLFD